MQRVAFSHDDPMRFVPFRPRIFQSSLDNLFNFASLELLRLFQLALVFRELTHGVRVNAFKAFQLVGQGDVVLAELIQFGLTHDAIGVQCPSAVALDVEGLMFSRNFLFRCVFVF